MNVTRVIGWAFALLLASGFIALGLWQYGRGEYKTAYLEAWEAALGSPPQALLPWDRPPRIDRPLPVAGELEALEGGRWWLLDNARRGSEVGLRAYFIADLGEHLGLLVDAGWLPFDRAKGLPMLDPPPARSPADGLLVPWPGQGIDLGDAPIAEGEDPVLLLRLERERIAIATGLRLVDGVLKLAPSADARYARDLDALPNTLPAEKHFGYALQWWGLAAATLAVAAVLTFRRPQR